MKPSMKQLVPVAVVALALLCLTHVSQSQQTPPMPMPAASAVTAGVAVISPIGGSKIAGVVKFAQVDGGVKVVADVTGLTPGKHGFHIHEFGDISDTAKGLSTGMHYGSMGAWQELPAEMAHPASAMHHIGEMGNLEADASGHAHMEITLKGLTIMGDKDPIIGRSIIVHANEDMGDRIGQAVIGVANPAAK